LHWVGGGRKRDASLVKGKQAGGVILKSSKRGKREKKRFKETDDPNLSKGQSLNLNRKGADEIPLCGKKEGERVRRQPDGGFSPSEGEIVKGEHREFGIGKVEGGQLEGPVTK